MSIEHDQARCRFWSHAEREGAWLDYAMIAPQKWDIVAVYVSPALRCRGLGRRLVDAAYVCANKQGVEVTASCPFAREVLASLMTTDKVMSANERALRAVGFIGLRQS
jgi:predicted GNAT family acetyltransferase